MQGGAKRGHSAFSEYLETTKDNYVTAKHVVMCQFTHFIT